MAGAAASELDPRFAQPRTLFFGVGAQKAATSWLDDYLRGHPEVCLPVRKEQHYWTTMHMPRLYDRRARVSWQLRKIDEQGVLKRLFRAPRLRAVDRAWRLSEAMLRENQPPGHEAYANVMFQAYRGEAVAGEITPAYALLGADAFGEMAGLGRDVRFVFIMRDPVSRLISAAQMNVRKRHRSDKPRPKPRSFEDRLAETLADPADTSLLRSRYDLTIQRLESAVPRDRIAYFFYETLFQQSELDRLTDFLGVARHPGRFERRVNAGRGDSAKSDARPALEMRALEVLAPTYGFVRERFGDLVPAKWRSVEPAMAMTAGA